MKYSRGRENRDHDEASSISGSLPSTPMHARAAPRFIGGRAAHPSFYSTMTPSSIWPVI